MVFWNGPWSVSASLAGMPESCTADGPRMATAPPDRFPSRASVAITGMLVLGLGLVVRAAGEGFFAKYGGIALYAAFIYVLVLLARVRIGPVVATVVATGLCWAVEVAQLSPVPADLSSRSIVFRLVLGSTFNPPDLFWYAVGAAVAGLVHWYSCRVQDVEGYQEEVWGSGSP